MRFMNTYEIDEARSRYAGHPVLGPATQTLANLRDVADANSDGWCYWPKPARSAARLMDMIERDGTARWRFDDDREDATAAELRKAYAPIKAFRTRSGLSFEIVEPVDIAARLEELRAAIDAESISYGEIAELESLAEYIEPGDVQLAEWAGIPEDEFMRRGRVER